MSDPSFTPPYTLFISGNGSLADPGKALAGGDAVLFKFIRLSNTNPDVLIPATAQPFVATQGRLLLTQRNFRPTLPGLLALYFIRTLQGVWKALRNRRRYDVALAASPFCMDVIPIWCSKARHKGAIIFHLLPERKPVNLATRIRFALAAMEQRVTSKVLRVACDFAVAGNEVTQRELRALLPGKPVFILEAGFDAAAIDRVPARPRDARLACFVGRMVSQKGIFDLLKVMEALGQEDRALRLVMAGTGPEQAFLEAEIRRRKLTNIELAGFVSDEQKFGLLKEAKYFFFPSYEEGWGIALAEALYCECRCVCYELPHYRSIFRDFPAYARLGDPEDFVRVFRQGGEVSPGQKGFMRRYDDPLVAQQLAGHLAAVARGTAVP